MISFKVNGTQQQFDGSADMPLLWYLRDILGLTGTKFGCGMACAVLAPFTKMVKPFARALPQ